MEDEDGYMAIDRHKRDCYTQPIPSKAQEPSSTSQCKKIVIGLLLAGSIALNVALVALVLVFQVGKAKDGAAESSAPSCDWVPGKPTASVSLDPNTAHPRLDVSSDGKTLIWGKIEKSLPNNTERFDHRLWVLGRDGFVSGKHCWEVELKEFELKGQRPVGYGEWSVGVAKQSVKRKGLPDFSTKEGIWGIGEYWGHGNYLAFTAPQHTKLDLDKKPRRIRVFMDYANEQVDFFNVETMQSIFTYSTADFSGEKIYPWFRVWNGTELVLHP